MLLSFSQQRFRDKEIELVIGFIEINSDSDAIFTILNQINS